MLANEKSESSEQDRPRDKCRQASGSDGGGVGGTGSDVDRDSNDPSKGSGPPGPFSVAFVDGRAVWQINDAKALVVDLGDEDGVQLAFLEDERPEDGEFASAVDDADERTAGRVVGMQGEEVAANLRRVVAYIGVGIGVGSESKPHLVFLPRRPRPPALGVFCALPPSYLLSPVYNIMLGTVQYQLCRPCLLVSQTRPCCRRHC